MTTLVLDIPGYPHPIRISGESFPAVQTTGLTFSEQLKGIESICNSFINFDKACHNVISTEGFNPVETGKKILAWIIEKIKELILAIQKFVERVRSYLSNEKHKKIMSIKDYSAEQLKRYLSHIDGINQKIELLFDDITPGRFFSIYAISKLWTSSGSQVSQFNDAYKKIMNKVNAPLPTSFPSQEEIANTFREDIQNITEIFKKINDFGNRHMDYAKLEDIPNIIRNYDILLKAHKIINDSIDEIRKAIKSLQIIVNELNSKMKNIKLKAGETVPYPIEIPQIAYVQQEIVVLNVILSELFHQDPAMIFPVLDRLIFTIYQSSKKV